MRIAPVLALLASLLGAACAQDPKTIGCSTGGVNSVGNACNPPNAAIGAASTVPFSGSGNGRGAK
jgi:hypothetical protein